MPRSSLALPALIALIALFVAPVAKATDVTQIALVGWADGKDRDRAPEDRFVITQTECTQNNALQFDYKTNATGNASLEVWAGKSCDQAMNRESDSEECWKVFATQAKVDGTVDLYAQDIARSQPDPCEPRDDFSFALYFMVLDGRGTLADGASFQTYDMTVDLRGPPPPSIFKTPIPGENSLELKWDFVDKDDPGGQDRAGYDVFCVPMGGSTASSTGATANAPLHFLQAAGGTSGTGDAGVGSSGAATGGTTTTTTDAGTQGSTSTGTPNPDCPTTAILEGEVPADDTYKCGEAQRTAVDRTVKGLDNDVTYAVGIASVDERGNVGELSAVQCGTPQIIEDFYERYRAAGGQGGGGLCSVPRQPGRGTTRGAWVLGLAGLLFVRRRGRLQSTRGHRARRFWRNS